MPTFENCFEFFLENIRKKTCLFKKKQCMRPVFVTNRRASRINLTCSGKLKARQYACSGSLLEF